MTLTINISATKTIEVVAPYFYKAGFRSMEYRAIFSEDKAIQVYLSDHQNGALIDNFQFVGSLPTEHIQITRGEFIAAYERAQKCINESFVKSCGFVEEGQDYNKIWMEEMNRRALTMAEGAE